MGFLISPSTTEWKSLRIKSSDLPWETISSNSIFSSSIRIRDSTFAYFNQIPGCDHEISVFGINPSAVDQFPLVSIYGSSKVVATDDDAMVRFPKYEEYTEVDKFFNFK